MDKIIQFTENHVIWSGVEGSELWFELKSVSCRLLAKLISDIEFKTKKMKRNNTKTHKKNVLYFFLFF